MQLMEKGGTRWAARAGLAHLPNHVVHRIRHVERRLIVRERQARWRIENRHARGSVAQPRMTHTSQRRRTERARRFPRGVRQVQPKELMVAPGVGGGEDVLSERAWEVDRFHFMRRWWTHRSARNSVRPSAFSARPEGACRCGSAPETPKVRMRCVSRSTARSTGFRLRQHSVGARSSERAGGAGAPPGGRLLHLREKVASGCGALTHPSPTGRRHPATRRRSRG